VLSADGIEVSKRRSRIVGGGVDVGGSVTSDAQELASQRQRVDVCVPSTGPVDLRLTTRSPLRPSPGRKVGLRLLAIQSDPLDKACPSRRS
jgi:hypothetical protein